MGIQPWMLVTLQILFPLVNVFSSGSLARFSFERFAGSVPDGAPVTQDCAPDDPDAKTRGGQRLRPFKLRMLSQADSQAGPIEAGCVVDRS